MLRSLRYLSVFAALLWVAATPARAEDKPLVDSKSEQSLPAGGRPSDSLTGFIMEAIGPEWKARINDCLAENELPKGHYALVLEAVQIKHGLGPSLWFVRPTIEPFCMALYGAHLFNYFLVEQDPSEAKPRYRLLFQNGGDGFAIYPQLSHGLNDIEATGCIATGCRSVRMSFDGQEYRPERCKQIHLNNDQEVVVTRQCGSDSGRDDQASGFDPPSGH